MIGSGSVGGEGVNDLNLIMDDLVQAKWRNSRVARKENDSIVGSGKLVFSGYDKGLPREHF